MKVLMINGSPHKEGCTYTALSEIARELKLQEIDSQIYHIGTLPIRGCAACGYCYETGLCIFNDDTVNECVELASKADGIIIGSPVYFASPNGSLISFLDRLFFLKSDKYAYKPAAAVVNCRRGGASTTFDVLNKYFTISNMPVVGSQYWNDTHGNAVEDVAKDLEGLQTMRTLARNMAWLIKCIAATKDSVPLPVREPWQATNFIR